MPLAQRAALFFERLRQSDSGIAAVEFGLILPLMLMIYMGLVEFSSGMRTSQRLDLVTHTLADLTAQQLPPNGTCPPGLTEANISDIFSAANVLMGLPSNSTAMKMTISEINITNPSSGVWQAKTNWTVTRNGGSARACGTPLTPSNVISATTIPPSYVQVTNGVNPTLGPFIVADVVYNYSPSVHFEFFKWASPPTWTMKRSNIAAPRNTCKAPLPQYTLDSHIQYLMTSGTNCNAPTP